MFNLYKVVISWFSTILVLRDALFTIVTKMTLTFSSIVDCSDSVIYIISFYYRLWKKNPSWAAIVKKKIWLWSSSVIKIVKMKYNRIDIKWWLVSTSFKIYIDILSYFYITFMIFYYNIIFPVLVKRTLSNRIIQFTCNAVNTHLNHIRIFLFSTPCGVGSLLCMRNINCKPHWLAICCLSRIFYFFLDRLFRS
jgi:hypothetical protein